MVTNVGWAHTENFPDGIEGVALAKRELIEELPPDGIAVLNADDPHVRAILAEFIRGRTILFGFSEDAEVRAEECRHVADRRPVSAASAWISSRRSRAVTA